MSSRPLFRDSMALLTHLVRFADAFGVFLAGLLAYGLRFDWSNLPSAPYLALVLIAALGAYAVFPAFGVYRSWRGHVLIDLVGRVLMAWAAVFFGIVVLLVLVKEAQNFSRLWLGIWVLTSFGFFFGLRWMISLLLHGMRRRGWNHRRVLIVGAGPAAVELMRRADRERWSGYEIVGVLTTGEQTVAAELPVAGDLTQLETQVEGRAVQEIWLALPLRDEAIVRDVMRRLGPRMVTIRYAPDIFGLRLLNHAVSDVMGLPMLDLSASPMTGINRLVKALEDRLLSLLILILISPVMLAVAVAVKLTSPGPVFFRQARLGWDGKPFEIWKFRSMVEHAEPDGQVRQATRDDERLTRIGAFLRRTSLDELPQFLNVLKGDMSIVGPRPHAVAHNEAFKDLVDGYMLRHKVKPGITGWAQINGWRGETDTVDKMRRRVEYDLYYIENWSLAFDLKIIVLTLFRGFVHKNAY